MKHHIVKLRRATGMTLGFGSVTPTTTAFLQSFLDYEAWPEACCVVRILHPWRLSVSIVRYTEHFRMVAIASETCLNSGLPNRLKKYETENPSRYRLRRASGVNAVSPAALAGHRIHRH